ncbi:MAG: MmgE/PrpD family protein [Clostridiaceae bacterium]|nr:MmgE/PrpD family protein [Clostridiaceae bacterium]
MGLTDGFLKEIENLFSNEIPAHVFRRAKIALLDYMAVTVAGAASHADKLEAYLREVNPEAGEIAAIGMKSKFTMKESVFLNGLNSHALDMDDGVNQGIIHLGAPIFSVLLPLAQKHQVTAEKLFKAVIIGYEAAFTIAISIQPHHKELGYHATGTCGVLGIALAVSYLLDFTEKERKNAFATASVSATGVLNVLDDGSELKPYNVAKSALLGLISCQMAKAGFAGPPDPLGSERGFLKMMTCGQNTVLKDPYFEGRYAIERTYTKPYAACRYCHPAIEASVNISSKHRIKLENIESVEVKTYSWAVNKHDHIDIPSPASAKMSIPYGVAIGLILGRAGISEYNAQVIEDPDILSLLPKIRVAPDDALTDIFPERTVAIVKVQTKDGSQFIERIDHPKGEPENSLTNEEFEQRFIDLFIFGGRTEKAARNMLDDVINMSLGQVFDNEKIN